MGGGARCEIAVAGRTACNRAVDGDIVAVEVLAAPLRALALLPHAADGAATLSPVQSLRMTAAPDWDVGDAEDGEGVPTLRADDAAPGVEDEEDAEEEGVGDSNPPPRTGHPTPVADASFARVVGIVSRRPKAIIATVLAAAGEDAAGEDDERRGLRFVLAVPMDSKLPKLRLATRQPATLRGQRLLLRVASWPADSQYPNATYVAALGPAGDLETEVRCIMIETGLDGYTRAFPPSALGCLPQLPPSARWSVAWHRFVLARAATAAVGGGAGSAVPPRAALDAVVAAETGGRRDLRWDTEICSVDPPGCTGAQGLARRWWTARPRVWL